MLIQQRWGSHDISNLHMKSQEGETETLGWNKTNLSLSRPRRDAFPEPTNDFVARVVTSVVRVLLPVVHVDIGHSSNQKLQGEQVEETNQA